MQSYFEPNLCPFPLKTLTYKCFLSKKTLVVKSAKLHFTSHYFTKTYETNILVKMLLKTATLLPPKGNLGDSFCTLSLSHRAEIIAKKCSIRNTKSYF